MLSQTEMLALFYVFLRAIELDSPCPTKLNFSTRKLVLAGSKKHWIDRQETERVNMERL